MQKRPSGTCPAAFFIKLSKTRGASHTQGGSSGSLKPLDSLVSLSLPSEPESEPEGPLYAKSGKAYGIPEFSGKRRGNLQK